MNPTLHYDKCPVCGGTDISFVLKAKDNTVSNELFSIWQCPVCLVRFTQDIPDTQSIARYYQSEDYISHSDTGKGIINRLYHFVRKRTLRRKRKLVEKFTGIKNGKILDVGCGTGAFLNEMKKAGWKITGLEPDKGARQMAEQLYGLSVKEPDELFNLEPESYDAITLWHVLEHVHDLHGYLSQLKKLVRPGGCLFIAVPNYTSHDASAYGEYWAGYDVPRHLYHFSPASMNLLAGLHGLKIITHLPMWYDSFYVSLLSSKYKNGKTNFIGAGWTGFVSNLKTLMNVHNCSSVIYVVKKN